jgi:hypothetical protein
MGVNMGNRLGFGFVLAFLAALFATNAAGSLVPLDEITVVGTICTNCGYPPNAFPYGPENTIDGDDLTFWHGYNNLQIGYFDILAYSFARPVQLIALSLLMGGGDPFFELYTLGELEIQTSTDTTNGFDGTWTTTATLPGTTTDFDVTVPISVTTEWLRLRPEYHGLGAQGSSPAFYLREASFEERQAATPEPGAIALLLLGLGATAFLRRKIAGT